MNFMVKGMTTIGIDQSVKLVYSQQKAIYASKIGHQVNDDLFLMYLLNQVRNEK